MQPEFHSGAVTRPLSAYLRLAMMGCPALRAHGELAAGACAPVLGVVAVVMVVVTVVVTVMGGGGGGSCLVTESTEPNF